MSLQAEENDLSQQTYIEAILKAAGLFNDDSNDTGNRSLTFHDFEQWLGLSKEKPGVMYEGLTIEDCVPLDRKVFELFWEWLQREWMTATTSVQMSIATHMKEQSPANMDTDKQQDENTTAAHQFTLEEFISSVRVTRYVRHLLELKVDQTLTVSQNFMQLDQTPPQTFVVEKSDQATSHRSRSLPLLKSLFQHIQELPVLEGYIHRYIQSLLQQHQQTTSTTTVLRDPQARLEQYARAQELGKTWLKEWQEHVDRLEVICGDWYRVGSQQARRQARRGLGRVWSSYIYENNSMAGAGAGIRQENTRAAGIRVTLRVLLRILRGVPSNVELHAAYVDLLFTFLVPLHRSDAMVLWRDQTCVLELYHEPLTQCCATLLRLQPSLLPRLVMALLDKDILPPTVNTPKQVLLLHEIDIYLKLLKDDSFCAALDNNNADSAQPKQLPWIKNLLTVLARCISSDNSRLAERALDFFRDPSFEKVLAGWNNDKTEKQHLRTSLQIMLPALLKRSWNPTVRKRTYHVLESLETLDKEVFEQICNELFATDASHSSLSQQQNVNKKSSLLEQAHVESIPTGCSLEEGMGSWTPPEKESSMPPPSSKNLGQKQQPPTTVTGVAPWAIPQKGKLTTTRPSRQPPVTVTGVAPWATSSVNSSSSYLKPQQPPLTVTGVAPWAVKANEFASLGRKRSAPPQHAGVMPASPSAMSAIDKSTLSSADQTNLAPESKNGYEFVKAFMTSIKPPPEETGASSWSKKQMADTPTLLPNLKFHDLVFGHDLGSGAFAVVRYARLIDRNKTRSMWPEYAVKIISTAKIKELGYEASVQREIAVLRILSHPGIARLVSSFRFQEGAYLVLEYASCGDLHHLLKKHGSLNNESTRFVIGEVIAALASIHDLGLVYSDLKTENILITETGHIKLTDFGGCRPVTDEAKETLRSISKDILKNLRDGGWKPQQAHNAELGAEEGTSNEEDEDSRIEGTTSYLPPEMIMGGPPTFAADAWALGCLTFQCLSGRPPFLEDDEETTRHRIVRFHSDHQGSINPIERLLEDKVVSSISSGARELIISTLQRDPMSRPDMYKAAKFSFFVDANVDVFSLYNQEAYPLDVGSVGPGPEDAKWSRRQFSSIWAPQPQAYDISTPVLDTTASSKLDNVSDQTGPIAEGEESSAFFSTSNDPLKKLGQISERLPPRNAAVPE